MEVSPELKLALDRLEVLGWNPLLSRLRANLQNDEAQLVEEVLEAWASTKRKEPRL